MKRRILTLLLSLLVTTTVWGGVRLDIDSGIVDGDSLSSEAGVIEGVTGDELSLTVMGEGAAAESPLTAVLFLGQESVQTFETVTLDASASWGGEGTIISYEWDFDGDGTFDATSADPRIEHAYSEAGTVLVQVRIVDDQGVASVSQPGVLIVENRQPLARFSVSLDARIEGQAIEFIESSYDEDGLITAWKWNFGDGTTATEAAPSHVYQTAGAYEVSLIVTDDRGRESAAYTLSLVVANSGPLAAFSIEQAGIGVGIPVVFQDESVDPGDDDRIVHVGWDFGDGIYLAGGPASDKTYTHTYTESGSYVVILFVIDEDGALARAQMTVTVP